MSAAVPPIVGAGAAGDSYEISDAQVAAGSTLGGPKCTCVIKATGAIERVYAPDYGKTAIGTIVAHHWDATTGVALTALPGHFRIHPEHQEHRFTLSNGLEVHEDIFVLSSAPRDGAVDPPAVYLTIELRNPTDATLNVGTYAFAELRGDTGHDVISRYDERRSAIVVHNHADANFVRVFACSTGASSWEVTLDRGKSIAKTTPGPLSGGALSPASDPLGVLHVSSTLPPGERTRFTFLVTVSLHGARHALRQLDELPSADDGLLATRAYYHEMLNRSVVLTPESVVNRGVLWAKANMLRTMLKSPTGWSFVNDPTRSNNSVARDTSWFAFGADYIAPDFARESLAWYAEHLEADGMVVEYYDIRTGKTADYKLNVNDNTPLLLLALWHHYNTTGDRAFLERCYEPAARAARYLLTQRNEQGLVWCTADGVADYGIAGWRNVIAGYRLSGATTELNSECYAALLTVSHMARELGRHDESAAFKQNARDLREAINAHLLDPRTQLYYLNIDLDGQPRSDVTSDLVFPVMFGVCDDEVAATIVSRLSADEFWTEAGIRTVPRNSPNYGPTHGYGLLGGVWVGVAFWYAFAAARFNPEFMAYALTTAFAHYSRDPRRNNTVPGQFSEWLHGETLVNQGMMLSPWFPPRYLWAAIEGAAGLDLSAGEPAIHPRLAPDWKWAGVRNVLFRGRRLTWFVVRTPEPALYTNAQLHDGPADVYGTDVSDDVDVVGPGAVAIALEDRGRRVLMIGNTTERTITTSVRVRGDLNGAYARRDFNSLRGAWIDADPIDAAGARRGFAVELDRKGFCLIELRADV